MRACRSKECIVVESTNNERVIDESSTQCNTYIAAAAAAAAATPDTTKSRPVRPTQEAPVDISMSTDKNMDLNKFATYKHLNKNKLNNEYKLYKIPSVELDGAKGIFEKWIPARHNINKNKNRNHRNEKGYRYSNTHYI